MPDTTDTRTVTITKERLDHLEGIEHRARVARGALWVDNADRYLVNYILDNTVPDRVPSPTPSSEDNP